MEQKVEEKPQATTKNKPFSIRRWITGENRYDWAQVFGPLSAPYFRYDPSHHLHRQVSRLRLAKNIRMHLLAAVLILTVVLQVVPLVIPEIRILLALLAIATSFLILLDRTRATKDKRTPIP